MNEETLGEIEEAAVGTTGLAARRFAQRLESRHRDRVRPALAAPVQSAPIQAAPVQARTMARPIQLAPPDGYSPLPPEHRRQESSAPGQDERQARPELRLLMPPPQPVAETAPPPSAMGTETGGGGAAAGHSAPRAAAPAKKADATAVADRVYDLMRQEIRLGLQRGIRPPGKR